ncbi:MAG TPA: Rid family hydrolase [Baekduia sp.]|nr:Rid family hydrolase [Baekduia sp.]
MHTLRSGSPFEELAAYSRATRIGDFVAVSGTAATDANGVCVPTGDAGAQTREALRRALEAAAALGARREDVLRTRLYLLAGADWRAAVEAHGEAFTGINPANTTLHVAELIPKDCLVEVELEAIASGPAAEDAA